MKKALWKFAMMADGILAFFFVTQFDVDDMMFQYIGAIVCILVFLFMLAIGWQWVMEYEKEQENSIDSMLTKK